MHILRTAVLTAAAVLVAAEPSPDGALPVPGSVLAEGAVAALDPVFLAARGMADPARIAGPMHLEVAAALGNLPNPPIDGTDPAAPDRIRELAASWPADAPQAGRPLGLLVVGPEYRPDRQRCRITSIDRLRDGVRVDIGIWSENPMPVDAAPAPQRGVWLLRLPPREAGPCAVLVSVHAWERGPGSGGLADAESWAGGPVLSCSIGAASAVARSSAGWNRARGRATRTIGGSEWLPRVHAWSHVMAAPQAVAGTGILGVRALDVDGIVAALTRGDAATPEAILASGSTRGPTLLVNGPMLNTGEHSTLRSAVWMGADRLEVTLAVWHDGLARSANIPHQETWLLPLHRPRPTPPAEAAPLRVVLTWESRFLDPATGWYALQKGWPRCVPEQAVMAWSDDAGARPGIRESGNDF